MTWEIGGYRAQQRMTHRGADDGVQVWRGVPVDGGDPVVLTVYDIGLRERLSREDALSATVAHPHLLAVSEVVESDTQCVLVTPLAPGGNLRSRLGAAPLEASQVITVLAGVAAGLVQLHRHEIVHGRVDPTSVLLGAGGRPLLARPTAGAAGAFDPAFDRSHPPRPGYVSPDQARGSQPTPADDVFALGSLAMRCLDGAPAWPADDLRDVIIQSEFGQWPAPGRHAPAALRALVVRMIDRDPDQRPTAAEILAELPRCGTPSSLDDLPAGRHARRAASEVDPAEGRAGAEHPRGDDLSVTDGDAADEPGEGDGLAAAHQIRMRRTLVGLVVTVLIAALSVGGGLWWAGSDRPQQAVLAGADDDWTTVVRGLDERRSAAFRSLDPTLLSEVYPPGSAALIADSDQIAAIAAAGVRVDSAAHLIESVTVVDELASPGPVLAVVDSLPAYPVRWADGTQVGLTTGTAPARRLLSLVAHGDGYRIAAITLAPAG